MPTIGKFFSDREGKSVAAMQSKETRNLYYYEASKNTPIPPSIYVWAHTSMWDMYREIMTSYGLTWASTYSAKEYLYKKWARDTYEKAVKIEKLKPDLWNEFNLTSLGSKPNLSSLYENTLSYGESRARRVYMLAAFCLLKKHGRKRYKTGGHNIGSILVGNDGEVLSWGINNGGFCHAEVNTILGYFAKHPDRTSLPAKSVLFTTLKPCQMCSTLIKDTQNTGSETRVWYGMMDQGKQGRSPLLGKNSTEFTEEDIVDVELDVFELLSEKGTLDSAIKPTQVKGTKRVQVGPSSSKVDLTEALNKSGGGQAKRKMSAADWVDKSDRVWKLVEASVTKFKGKVNKPDRDDGPMKSTLNYLKGWAV